MQGFVSDEMDKKHAEVFSEGSSASRYLKRYLSKPGDREHYVNDDDGTWLQLVNKDGRLWLEVGEGAA